MNRTLRLLVIVLVLVGAGYGVMVAVIPEARPWDRGNARPSNRPAGAGGREQTSDPGEYEKVAVTIEIPAARDVPTGGAHGGRCPKDQLCNILGVKLAQPHGLVVGTVVPDGPADKAGIKEGDMLGTSAQCPSMTVNRFLPDSDPRELELTVRRPVSSTEGETAETGPGEQEASSE